jgi:hypothetical protein
MNKALTKNQKTHQWLEELGFKTHSLYENKYSFIFYNTRPGESNKLSIFKAHNIIWDNDLPESKDQLIYILKGLGIIE